MKENKNPFIEEIFFLSSEMHIFFIFIFKICAFLNEFNNISTILHHSILTFFLKLEFFIFCGIAHNIQSRARQIFFDLTKLLRKPDASNQKFRYDEMVQKIEYLVGIKKYEVRGS